MLQVMLGCSLKRFSNPLTTKAEQLPWHRYVFIPLACGSWSSGMAPLEPIGQKDTDVRAEKAFLEKLILMWNSLLLPHWHEWISFVMFLLPDWVISFKCSGQRYPPKANAEYECPPGRSQGSNTEKRKRNSVKGKDGARKMYKCGMKSFML